jgi:glycosyltransferase involved in cell wall biosynthesis
VRDLHAAPTAGRVVWNGIDGCARAALKEPFILAAGRLWDEAKNVSALVCAAPRLSWPVRLAGPVMPPSADAAADPAIPGVQFLGGLSRQDLMQEMQGASIFAAPAVYEPFGLTVLEAASAGCALVLADIDSFRELWDGAALFVEPRAEMLQAALEHVIRDQPLRQELQRWATRRARRYSLDAMSGAYQALYENLIRDNAAAALKHPKVMAEARP